MCILCGCDYAGTIRGIGSGKVPAGINALPPPLLSHSCFAHDTCCSACWEMVDKVGQQNGCAPSIQMAWCTDALHCEQAYNLVQKHGSLEGVIANLDKDKYPIPDPYPYEEARRLFKGAR